MATENSDQSSTSVTEIAKNGDIILVVGPHKKKIQVCSTVLKNASKYFNAMFGPHFAEGQDLHGDSPKGIPMPDDDANALEILLNIFHLRNDDVPETLGPTEVLDVAVAADKFDCIVAIKHAIRLWLNPGEFQDIVELGHLMAAAYRLDNARAFSEITLAMILLHKDSYLPLADEDIGLLEIVPWKVICFLEERRSRMRVELQQILLDGERGAGTDDDRRCSCSWSSRHSSAYMELLRTKRSGPLQTLDTTISEVLEKLENMDDPTISREWDPCDYRWHTDPKFKRMRNWRLNDFKKSKGLCIDCVRSSTVAARQICRIEH
ncbi:uncharacterized protein BDZ99DRAFT_504179 [Mytilinidion resinicola]|uniref:BTB domain-containing protein n=1 Tax=Mytilinidion resinicola TaxID=574789 RepID=A0A6A6Y1L6_9PEZI|nr:uncharacterized protein BDZ99DRAFT_504179 [Mytilinidion resinicola]KAF2801904.1 hypothetical protein BDZ99DRAFT_504179 [Mytilinidion resinicola]